MERLLAWHGARSHGVVARRRLLADGVSAAEIRSRLESGALLREHPGVYRVGHRAPSDEATYAAAVLACGPGAVLFGPAAAHLHRLTRNGAPAPPPSVLTPTERSVPGVRTQRARAGIDRRDVIVVDGIPATTIARTVVDLAAELTREELALSCHEALVRDMRVPRKAGLVLDRRPTSAGAGELRRILYGDGRISLSKLERRFLARLRAAGLPLPPQTNQLAHGRRVDCHWTDPPLTVELDGYRFHGSRHAWESDRRREREARAGGDEFRRYTYGDVFEEPEQMLEELRLLLAETTSRERPG